MSGKRNSLIFLLLVVPCWSMASSVVQAQAAYTNLSFWGTVRVVYRDTGGIFTGTEVGDAFLGSFLYGLTDDDADISPRDEDGYDGTDYNFRGWPYNSFITNGTISVSRSTVKCGSGDNLPMEPDESMRFSDLSGSSVELGFVDDWDVGFDGASDADYWQPGRGSLEFGVAVFSWNDLDWMTDEEFYSTPPNPNMADITAFFIDEHDASDESIFVAYGLVDQLEFGVVPAPGDQLGEPGGTPAPGGQSGQPAVIPAPGALILAGIGASLVTFIRRHRGL